MDMGVISKKGSRCEHARSDPSSNREDGSDSVIDFDRAMKLSSDRPSLLFDNGSLRRGVTRARTPE